MTSHQKSTRPPGGPPQSRAGALSIGELAALAGVSARTLRHYEAAGLLAPERTSSGYREYQPPDVARLREILLLRNLGFTVAEVKSSLGQSTQRPCHVCGRNHSFDRHALFTRKRAEVSDRIRRDQERLRLIDEAIGELERQNGSTAMTDTNFTGLEDVDKYADEARQRWGDTDAYQESARRTKKLTQRDWLEIKGEQRDQVEKFAQIMSSGLPPDSVEAMAAAEEARLLIDARFYPCSLEMHVNLGEVYVEDPRFTDYYEEVRPGLAHFVRDAIIANAALQLGRPGGDYAG